MTNEKLLIEGTASLEVQRNRIDKFFQTLSEEQLQQEIRRHGIVSFTFGPHFRCQ